MAFYPESAYNQWAPPQPAQQQRSPEDEAMDQILAFHKAGQKGMAGSAGSFMPYTPSQPNNLPGSDATSGPLQRGMNFAPASTQGRIAITGPAPPPIHIQSGSGVPLNAPSGWQGVIPQGTRMEDMSGGEFARGMNAGMLRDPNNIPLAGLDRWLRFGSGQLQDQSPDAMASRQKTIDAFMGMSKESQGWMQQGTEQASRLGQLGVNQQAEQRLLETARHGQDPNRMIDAMVIQYAQTHPEKGAEEVMEYRNRLRAEMAPPTTNQVVSNQDINQFNQRPKAPPKQAWSNAQEEQFKKIKATDPATFLAKLNDKQADNGAFIQANFPAIEAYLKNEFGTHAWNMSARGLDRSGQAPFGSYGFTDYIPFLNLGARTYTALNQKMYGPSDYDRGASALFNELQRRKSQPIPIATGGNPAENQIGIR